MFRKFNVRTMAGRHIVFDHLLSSVVLSTDPRRRYYSFAVDENGILVSQPQEHVWWERNLSSYEPEVTEWLAGRFVGMLGKYLFWFIPVTRIFWSRGLSLFGSKPVYRQTEKLSSEDKKYFYSLTKKAQRELFERGAEYIPNIVM